MQTTTKTYTNIIQKRFEDKVTRDKEGCVRKGSIHQGEIISMNVTRRPRFTALHRCCVFCKLKTRPSPPVKKGHLASLRGSLCCGGLGPSPQQCRGLSAHAQQQSPKLGGARPHRNEWRNGQLKHWRWRCQHPTFNYGYNNWAEGQQGKSNPLALRNIYRTPTTAGHTFSQVHMEHSPGQNLW